MNHPRYFNDARTGNYYSFVRYSYFGMTLHTFRDILVKFQRVILHSKIFL